MTVYSARITRSDELTRPPLQLLTHYSHRLTQKPGAHQHASRKCPTSATNGAHLRSTALVTRRKMAVRTAKIFVGSDSMPHVSHPPRRVRPPTMQLTPKAPLGRDPPPRSSNVIGAVRASLTRSTPRREQAHSRDRLLTPPKLRWPLVPSALPSRDRLLGGSKPTPVTTRLHVRPSSHQPSLPLLPPLHARTATIANVELSSRTCRALLSR